MNLCIYCFLNKILVVNRRGEKNLVGGLRKYRPSRIGARETVNPVFS